MAFCEINSFAVDITDDDWTETQQDIGAMGRSHGGTYRKTRWARKLTFEGLTGVYDEADGEAVRSLLQGDGDVWSFDDATYYDRSSRGTGLVSGTATRTTSSPAPKFGAACVEIASGASVVFATELGTSWTIMHWRDLTGSGSGTWAHYVLTSAGDYWVDGVKNTGADPGQWSSVSSGQMTLQGKDNSGSNAAAYYDDVVALPYVVTDEMASAFGGRSAAWPGLPRLEIGGDCVASTKTVIGDVEGPELFQARDDDAGQWTNNLRRVSFVLHEE